MSTSSASSSGATTFKFLPDESPQPQLFTDVQNLNAFDETQLAQFTSVTLAFLAQKEDSRTRMEQFSADHKINLRALENTIQGVLYFFSESLRRTLKQSEVKSDLLKLGLQETKAEILAASYQKEFSSLTVSLIDSTLKINQLVDMEWKFGVTAGTSELSDAGTCFLQLRLVTMKDGKRESVLMEMTLPQFYSFLTNMQKAAVAIQQAE